MTKFYIQVKDKFHAELYRKNNEMEEVCALFPKNNHEVANIPKDNSITLVGHSDSATFGGSPKLGDKSPDEIAEALAEIYKNEPNKLKEIFIMGCESGMQTQGFMAPWPSFADQLNSALVKRGICSATIYTMKPPADAHSMIIQTGKIIGSPFVSVSAYYFKSKKDESRSFVIQGQFEKIDSCLAALENQHGGTTNLRNWESDPKKNWDKLTKNRDELEKEDNKLKHNIVSDRDHDFDFRKMLRETGYKSEIGNLLIDDEKKREIIEHLNSSKTTEDKNGEKKHKNLAEELIKFITDNESLTISRLNEQMDTVDKKYHSKKKVQSTVHVFTGKNTFRKMVTNPIREILATPTILNNLELAGRVLNNVVVTPVLNMVSNQKQQPTCATKQQPTCATKEEIKAIKSYYKYGEARRNHEFPVKASAFKNLNDKYQQYDGDSLKTEILVDVYKHLQTIKDTNNLEKYKNEFKVKAEYKVLKTAQDTFTRIFSFFKSTDSMIAFEKLFQEKEALLTKAQEKSNKN